MAAPWIEEVADALFLRQVWEPAVLAAWVRATLREQPALATRLRAGDAKMVEVLFGVAFRDSRYTVAVVPTKAMFEFVRLGGDAEALP